MNSILTNEKIRIEEVKNAMTAELKGCNIRYATHQDQTIEVLFGTVMAKVSWQENKWQVRSQLNFYHPLIRLLLFLSALVFIVGALILFVLLQIIYARQLRKIKLDVEEFLLQNF